MFRCQNRVFCVLLHWNGWQHPLSFRCTYSLKCLIWLVKTSPYRIMLDHRANIFLRIFLCISNIGIILRRERRGAPILNTGVALIGGFHKNRPKINQSQDENSKSNEKGEMFIHEIFLFVERGERFLVCFEMIFSLLEQGVE